MKTFFTILATILVTSFVTAVAINSQSNNQQSTYPTLPPLNLEPASPQPTQLINNKVVEPPITCLGPDGKTAKMTRQACYDLGKKWSKPVQILDDVFPPKATQNNTSTVAKSYICQIFSDGSIYYTRDISECNQYKDSKTTSSLKASSCKNESNTQLNACLSPCDQSYNNGKAVCSIAYTSENATIIQDNSKYSECLNENNSIWQSCTKPCYDESVSDFNSCLAK